MIWSLDRAVGGCACIVLLKVVELYHYTLVCKCIFNGSEHGRDLGGELNDFFIVSCHPEVVVNFFYIQTLSGVSLIYPSVVIRAVFHFGCSISLSRLLLRMF